MRKVSALVGQPIVSAASGERIGKVSDVLLDAETRHVVGRVVRGGLFTSEQVLPYEDVQSPGEDAVIARSTRASSVRSNGVNKRLTSRVLVR
jgi:uncharacterized protein YrrD